MEQVERILIFLPVLLVSVVLHEVAHGWVARSQGDPTAERAGRLTLNPAPHIDPIGSLVVPLVLLLMPGGLLFGWARPVPVDPRNFRHPKRGDILVSLAGVAVNLLLAVLFAGLMAVGVVLAGGGIPEPGGTATVGAVLYRAGALGVILNLILTVFNLLPIPPLDGSHVVAQLLPARLRTSYRQLGRYGLGILLLIVFLLPDLLDALLWPAYALAGIAFQWVESLA